MTILVVGLQLALVVTLLVSATAKVTDADGSREALAAFGVPRRLAGTVALVLPGLEVAAAILLLVPATVRAGAAVTLALLTVFSVAVALTLARGRRPHCNCFGRLSRKPIGAGTLVRNAALAAAALTVVLLGGTGVGGAVIDLLGGGGALAWWAAAATLALALVAAAALAFAVAALRAHARALTRIDQLEGVLREAGHPVPAPEGTREGESPRVGAPAPQFRLAAAEEDGRGTTLDELLSPGRGVLLVFIEPRCPPCREIVPDLARWQRAEGAPLVVPVSGGRTEDARALAQRAGLDRLLLDPDDDVFAAYGCEGTPSGVLVTPDGAIAHPVATGPREIRSLFSEAARPRTASDPVWTDTAAVPPPWPGSVQTELAHLLDPARSTLVLFWDQGCPHCQAMQESLERALATAGPQAPRLVVVTEVDDPPPTRLARREQVVPDPGRALARSLGIRGTPSAVLLAPGGGGPTAVGVGARDVLSLLRPRLPDGGTPSPRDAPEAVRPYERLRGG